jgi:hypothetical protein
MTYAFVQDVPANEEMYHQIKAILGDTPPAGLIAHVACRHGDGLRYIDLWETEEAWETFRVSRVEPAVAQVLAGHGIVPDHSQVRVEALDVIDTWIGAQHAAAR